MPGYKARKQRTAVVQLRLDPEQLKRWTEYASYDGVSALIRTAVERLMQEHPSPKKRPPLDR